MLDKNFLKQLTAVRGVSGHEREVQAVFLGHIRHHAAKLHADLMDSVWGVINPGAPNRVLLDCHADEIGFLIRFISEDGLVYLQPIGSHSIKTAVSQRVVIKNERNFVYGVIGTKPHHMQSAAERSAVPPINDIWVDIGARNGAEARQMVNLGDPVSYVSELTELGGRRVSSPALDNRVGMYVVAEAFARLSNGLEKVELTAMSSVQEEIGMRGAEAAISRVNPQIAIVVDVCHTTDTPGLDKRLLGDVSLGRGPVIVRGPNTNSYVFKRLIDTAKGFGIPYQVQPSSVVTSTDAGVIQVANGGVAVGIISVPIRYMHTPNEVMEWSDLEAAVDLAEAFVRSCSSGISLGSFCELSVT
ncbi:MAG: M20/M25/M40 family metallo-hydrolase [Candidatus Bruticola sp.]